MFFPVSVLQEAGELLKNDLAIFGRMSAMNPGSKLKTYQLELNDDTGKNIGVIDLVSHGKGKMIWLPARSLLTSGIDIKKTLEYHGLALNKPQHEESSNDEQPADRGIGDTRGALGEDQPVRDRGDERTEQSVLSTGEPGAGAGGDEKTASPSSAPSPLVEHDNESVEPARHRTAHVKAVQTGGRSPVQSEVTTGVPQTNTGVPGGQTETNTRVPGVAREAATPFVLSDEILAESRSPKVKAAGNIEAINLLSKLDTEERNPSEDERIVLARYVGWGGLPNAFRGIDGSIKKGWEDIVVQLESALDPHALSSARRSTLDAHFTPAAVVQAMWQGVQAIGMEPQKISEPSCGSGNFVGFAPESLQRVFNLVEKDVTTFKIASYLYPKAHAVHSSFERTHPIVKPSYDLVIGNPPFGDQRVFDAANPDISQASPNIHSYFFNKSMALLAPGGVQAMVVSRYLMDSAGAAGREFRLNLAKQAHLLGAVRLPDTAFAESAGTSVITDILFLQKRAVPLLDDDVNTLVSDRNQSGPLAWVDTTSVTLPHQTDSTKMGQVTINNHYMQHPELILGSLSVGRGMYRDDEMMVSSPDGSWKERLPNAMRSMTAVEAFPDSLRYLNLEKTSVLSGYPKYNAPNAQQGSVVLVKNTDGDPMLGSEVLGMVAPYSQLGYTPIKIDDARNDDTDMGDEHSFYYVSKAAYERLTAYIPIRDTMMALIKEQVTQIGDDTRVMDGLREKLQADYRKFIDRFGLLNRTYNVRALDHDSFFPQVSVLERNYKKPVTKATSVRTGEPVSDEQAEMADIFFKRTQFPPVSRVESASTAEDALRISLSYTGAVNPAYMSSLIKKDWQDIRTELSEKILFTPEGWGLSESVLSGDIRTKIKSVTASMGGEFDNGELQLTLDKLEKIIPEDRQIEQIPLTQGSEWIPLKIHQAFMDECFGAKALRVDYIPSLRQWEVEKNASAIPSDEFITKKVPAYRMARYFLRDESIVVKVEGEVDIGETELARAKMDKLKEKWSEWIISNPERNAQMVRIFNDRFNRFVKPTMSDGQFLETPDRSPGMTPRPTQKAGAWYCIQHKAALLDHAVGAGKTLTAVVAAHEMKRMGLIRKPMITMPNGLEGQWLSTIMDNYPNDRVVCATEKDMSSKNRQRFLARIASDSSIDFVLMPHSSFPLIPRDHAHEIEFLQSELDRFQKGLVLVKNNSQNKKTVKEVEKKIARMEAKIERLLDKSSSRDSGLTFSDLGVDALFVDESQHFKNIPFETSYRNVKGLGNPAGSGKAFDMLIKARSLIDSGGRYIDMSGTPEANSIAEVYLEQLKLAPQTLKAMGIHSFDQWFFAEKQTEFQFSMSGAYKEQTYLNKFNSLRILREAMSSFRHIITIEDVKEQALAAGMPPVKIPRLEGGAAQIISVKKTNLQDVLIGHQIDVDKTTGAPIFNSGSVLDRVSRLGSRKPEKGEDNILVCISDLNKLALSSKEFLKKSSHFSDAYGDVDDDSPKLLAAQDRIFADYAKWEEDRGTTLVFLDISTPKKTGRVSKETQLVRDAVAAVDAGASEFATDADVTAAVAAEEYLSGFTLDEIDELLQDGASWSAYVDLKEKLVSKGIPAHEIAFIHDYDGLEKRDDLFGKVRSGSVRVLMGSTSKMGAGVNVQNRIIGMHMLDAAYRPDQMEQRIGRMLRQGNELLEKYGDDKFSVGLYYYVLEGSADAARYQLLANKKKFLDALRGGDSDEIADPESSAFNPQAIMAAASGNRVLQDRAVITSSLKRVESVLSMVRQQNQNRAYEIGIHKRNIEQIGPVLDTMKDFYQQALDDSTAIGVKRMEHDQSLDSHRAAVTSVREEHRVWVAEAKAVIEKEVTEKLEAEALPGIKVTKKAIDEACRAIYQEKTPLWGDDLTAKIKAAGTVTDGYIDVALSDGATLKGLTVTQVGQLVQEAIAESRNTRKSVAIGDIERVHFEVFMRHSEITGTTTSLRARNINDTAGINVVSSTIFNHSTGSSTTLGMEVVKQIKSLATEARLQINLYERSVAYMESHRTKTDATGEGEYILQRDFLRSLSNASLGLLRCGVTSWEDGCDVRHVMDLPDDYWDKNSDEGMSPSLVRLAKSTALKEVAKDFILPHIGVIKMMRDEGHVVMEALEAKKPVSAEIIKKNIMASLGSSNEGDDEMMLE